MPIQLASAACTLALVLASTGSAQTTERVSVSSTGVEGDGQTFETLSTSSDGRFVAFCSAATNLVPGGTNSFGQVFVRDRQSGTTELVSVNSAGAQSNNGSYSPSISADGRYVAFESLASNLDPIDMNGGGDVFLHDRVTGTTEMVDLTTTGTQATGGAQRPSVSDDGRYVAFVGGAADFVPGDTNMVRDVFVRDRLLGTTERVNVDSSGAQANADSAASGVMMSPDGRYVAFESQATNLVPGDTNTFMDAFVHDRLTGVTERVSVDSNGLEGNEKSGYYGVFISADGRYAAFTSFANNLVAGDTNARIDVFVRDRLLGTTERVNVSQSGAEANNASGTFRVSISRDGRFVTYDSQAYNLVPGTQSASDVYLRDRQLGTTELVSVDVNGLPVYGHSNISSISGDGRFVAFHSTSGTLVPGDTNGVSDTFVHDRGASSGTPFCFGDGSGTACPCGNASAIGAHAGCLSSLGTGGVLAATGTPSIGTDTLVLHGSGMPSSSVLYFQGTTQVNAGSGAVFGDGLRCAGGSIIRLGPNTNVAGVSQWPDAGDPSISVKGADAAGNSRTYQAWYRNAAAFCSPAAFNLTNGWGVTWVP